MQRPSVVGYEWCDFSLLLRSKWHNRTREITTAAQELELVRTNNGHKLHNNQPQQTQHVLGEFDGE
eukprot:scaffold156358_cov71-Cyclotella_meneghiniana.AAC.1